MLQKKFCSGLIAFTLVLISTIRSTAQVAISTPEQVGSSNREMSFKPVFDDDASTWYAVNHDDKALYIHVAIKDSLQKRKVLQNGMELWIDVKGRKNKETGILFPLGEKANIYPGGGNRNAAGGPPPFFNNSGTKGVKNEDSVIKQLVATKRQATLKGFNNASGQPLDISQLQGVTINLQLQHETLVYDAIIPFASLPQQPAKTTVSIGIVENGIELPGFGGDGPPGGDEFGGGPPPGGGGMMGPPGGGDSDDFKRLFQINVIWYKIKLHS
ncbi:MAG TPA: hypothetical protein VG738_10400 [Chitinophagaceae bacterium]|nr:hypothetical protein [Chitinophagaceae bacterium]